MNSKPIWQSKTLWINVVAIIAMTAQALNSAWIISPELQGSILAVINLALRIVTGTSLDWSVTGTTPTNQDNGQAGFVSLPLLVVMLALGGLMLLAGCATTGAVSTPAASDSPQVLAGKSLLAVKSTIVTAAPAVDGLCRSGAMAADKCAAARVAYEQAKPAYDTAVDAYLLMTSGEVIRRHLPPPYNGCSRWLPT